MSNYLAIANRLSGTSSQFIVDSVQAGHAAVGPIQLVVSYTMLSRLLDVLVRKGASLDTASRFISLIEAFSRLGPAGEFPHVVRGGVAPTRDARMPRYDPYDVSVTPGRYDVEDGRVIDTAIAGRAHALVTANIRDFVERHDSVITPGRVHVRRLADHRLIILRPADLAAWLKSGKSPAPAS